MANDDDDHELQPEADTQNRSAVEQTSTQRKQNMAKVHDLIQEIQNRSYTAESLRTESVNNLVGKQLGASYAQVETTESQHAMALAKSLIKAICGALKSCYVVVNIASGSRTPDWVYDPQWAKDGEALEAILHHVAAGFHALLEGFEGHVNPPPDVVENMKICRLQLATQILPVCMELAASEEHSKLCARTRREFLDIVYVAIEGYTGRRARAAFRKDPKNEAFMAQIIGKTKDRHQLDAVFKLLCCVSYAADSPPAGTSPKDERETQNQSATNKKQAKGKREGKGKAREEEQDPGFETQEARTERLGNLIFGRNPRYNTFTPQLSKWLINEYLTLDGKAMLKSTTKRITFCNKLIDAIVKDDLLKPQRLIVTSLEVPHYKSKFDAPRVCISSKEEQAAAKEGGVQEKSLEYALYVNERSISTWLEAKFKTEEEDEVGVWELYLDQIQSIDYASAGTDLTLLTFASITPSEFSSTAMLGEGSPKDGPHLALIHMKNDSVQKMKETLSQRYLPILQDRSCLKPGSSVSKPTSRLAKVVAARDQVKPPKSSQPLDISGPDRTPPMQDGVDALKARVEGLDKIVNQDTSEESIGADSIQPTRRSSRETAVKAQQEVVTTITSTTTIVEKKGDGSKAEKMAIVKKVETTAAPDQTGFDLSESELSDLDEQEEETKCSTKQPKAPAQSAVVKEKAVTTSTAVETGSKRKLNEQDHDSKIEKKQKVSSEDSAEDVLPDLQTRKKDKEIAAARIRGKPRDSGFDDVLPPPIHTTEDNEEDSGDGTDYDMPEDGKKKSKQGAKEVNKVKKAVKTAAKKAGAARKLASSTPVKKKRGSRGGASESDSSKATATTTTREAPKGRTIRAAKSAAAQAISEQASDNASQNNMMVNDPKTKARVTSDVPPDSDPVEPPVLPSAVPSKRTTINHAGDTSVGKKSIATFSQLCNSNIPENTITEQVEEPELQAQDKTEIWDEGISTRIEAQRKASSRDGRRAIPMVHDEPRTDDAFEELLANPPTVEVDPVRQYTTVLDNMSTTSAQPEAEDVAHVDHMGFERDHHRRSASIAMQVEGPSINILPPSLTGYKANIPNIQTRETQPKVEDPAGVLSSPAEEVVFENQMDDIHFSPPIHTTLEPEYVPHHQDRQSPVPDSLVDALPKDRDTVIDSIISKARKTAVGLGSRQVEKLEQAETQRKTEPPAVPTKKQDDQTDTKLDARQPFLPTESRQKRVSTVPEEPPMRKGPLEPVKVKRVRASKMKATAAPPLSPPVAADYVPSVASNRAKEIHANRDPAMDHSVVRTHQDKQEPSHDRHDYDGEPEKYGRRASSVTEASQESELGIMNIMQKLNQVLLADLHKKKELYSASRDSGVEGIVQVVQAGLTQALKADATYFSGLKELNEDCHDLQKRAVEPLASLEKEISNEFKKITIDIASLGQIKALFAKRCPVGIFRAMPTCDAIRTGQE